MDFFFLLNYDKEFLLKFRDIKHIDVNIYLYTKGIFYLIYDSPALVLN